MSALYQFSIRFRKPYAEKFFSRQSILHACIDTTSPFNCRGPTHDLPRRRFGVKTRGRVLYSKTWVNNVIPHTLEIARQFRATSIVINELCAHRSCTLE